MLTDIEQLAQDYITYDFNSFNDFEDVGALGIYVDYRTDHTYIQGFIQGKHFYMLLHVMKKYNNIRLISEHSPDHIKFNIYITKFLDYNYCVESLRECYIDRKVAIALAERIKYLLERKLDKFIRYE